jgi:hypothetical protein
MMIPLLLQGLVSSVAEVIAMCVLVFLVLTELSPGVAILVLNGVFFVQILIDVYSSLRRKQCLARYNHMNEEREVLLTQVGEGKYMTFLRGVRCITEHYIVKIIAGLFQLLGAAGWIGYWIYMKASEKGDAHASCFLRPLIGLPLVLLTLSIIWSNRFQEAIAHSNVRKNGKKVSARYKSSELLAFEILMICRGHGQ